MYLCVSLCIILYFTDCSHIGNEICIDIQIVTLYLYLFLVNFWLNLGVWQRNLDGKRKGATAGLQCRKLPLEEV